MSNDTLIELEDDDREDDDRVGWIQFSDGSWACVDAAGYIGDEFTIGDLAALTDDDRIALPAVVIAIEPASVIDTELPQRIPLVGPPAPVDLPVELVERIAAAVREWGSR